MIERYADRQPITFLLPPDAAFNALPANICSQLAGVKLVKLIQFHLLLEKWAFAFFSEPTLNPRLRSLLVQSPSLIASASLAAAAGALSLSLLGLSSPQSAAAATADVIAASAAVPADVSSILDLADFQAGFASAVLATRRPNLEVFAGTFGALAVLGTLLNRTPLFSTARIPPSHQAEKAVAGLNAAEGTEGGISLAVLASVFALVFTPEWGDKSFFSTIVHHTFHTMLPSPTISFLPCLANFPSLPLLLTFPYLFPCPTHPPALPLSTTHRPMPHCTTPCLTVPPHASLYHPCLTVPPLPHSTTPASLHIRSYPFPFFTLNPTMPNSTAPYPLPHSTTSNLSSYPSLPLRLPLLASLPPSALAAASSPAGVVTGAGPPTHPIPTSLPLLIQLSPAAPCLSLHPTPISPGGSIIPSGSGHRSRGGSWGGDSAYVGGTRFLVFAAATLAEIIANTAAACRWAREGVGDR
ncbi:unnamed protein product [Closterium sp. Naga37s-1]|nr:unnamed protein product [Closterium sp. Naga37s-1]